ncbi:MAG TPA: gliding motility-associated C-terminal domain-containing protein [Bacteroidia bacterium]
MKKIVFSLLAVSTLSMFSQQGKDGPGSISASTVVNSYTTLSLDVIGNPSTIEVASVNALPGGGVNTLTAGDLIMIIQMQGATTRVTSPYPGVGDPGSAGPYNDSLGEIISYNGAGNNEIAEISSVSGTTLTLTCPLKNNYTIAGKTQIVRIPRYTSLTISGAGIITCPQWTRANGYGGVISIEVHGNTTIAAGGKIDASGLGFRGGVFTAIKSSAGNNSMAWGTSRYNEAANKGEGIAGDSVVYGTFSAKLGLGAIANGGGGGVAVNGGGGGGANAGTVAWTGKGVPDRGTGNAYDNAWNAESGGFATSNSGGGGRGGYSWSSTNSNPLNYGPNNTSSGGWTTGDHRRNVGGLGGRPLNYSNGALYMGGGGGSGDGDNQYQGAGGNGGGIIYFLSYGTISGGGQIAANGADGEYSHPDGPAGSDGGSALWGRDGAGGAGGGGAIVVNSTGSVSGVSISANGGKGGDQLMTKPIGTYRDAYGPGGGGGGGYVGISAAVSVTPTVNGGNNGIHGYRNSTTANQILSLFPPNGATKGGAGQTATTTTFSITTTGSTICAGTSAVLTASLTGTAPNPVTVNWYTDAVGGTPIATGTSYTTAVLNNTATYYVGTCPGTYREPVTVTVGSAPTVNVNSNSICNGQSIVLTATGSASSFSWDNGANGASITVSPTTTTQYTVTGSNGPGCSGTATATVTVNDLPPVNATSSPAGGAVCTGDQITLSGSGATSYAWTGGITDAVAFTPASSGTYTVTGTDGNGCQATATFSVTVNNLPQVTVNSPSTCSGVATTLTANGDATSYSWSTLETTQSISVSPTINTSYTVTGTDANGCENTAVASVTITSAPSVTVNSESICNGQSVTLTGNNAASFSWNTGDNTASITVNPTTTTQYTVTGSNGPGCSGTAIATVTVNNLPPISANSNPLSGTICNGQSITLSGNGGISYSWTGGITNGTAFIPTSSATYTVTGTDGAGCQNTASISIVVNMPAPVSVISIPVNASVCSGQQVTLSGDGAVSYTWTGGITNGTAFTPTSSGTYTVTGTDANGCQNTATASVTVNIPPVVSFTTNGGVICENGCVQFAQTVSPAGATLLWSFGDGNTSALSSPNNCYANAGTYTVSLTASSGAGCSSTSTVPNSVIVTQGVNAQINVSPGTTVSLGTPVSFVADTGLAQTSYAWSFADPTSGTANASTIYNPTHLFAQTGVYCVTLTAGTSTCTDVAQTCIEVILEAGLVIPNIFTPNNDGLNDLFVVKGTGIKSLEASIYDRWGIKLYSWDGLTGSWDGKSKGGALASNGVYYYIINATDYKNETKTYSGYTQLLAND